MTRAAFRQADIERILRAAKAVGAVVQIDIRTLVVTIHANPEKNKIDPLTGLGRIDIHRIQIIAATR
jgi:hypothetical protein